jgi:hypothetical protein
MPDGAPNPEAAPRSVLAEACVEWALLKNGNRSLTLEQIKWEIRAFDEYDYFKVAQIAAMPHHESRPLSGEDALSRRGTGD